MNPTVCAICLTADRPAMTKRAVESFRAQTYENKQLLIYDTGQNRVELPDESVPPLREKRIYHEWWNAAHKAHAGQSIGKLRNTANAYTNPFTQHGTRGSEILMHWDSDDWSHPNRITEQVALLQASGADCVGFNEMLFWKDQPCSQIRYPYGHEDCPECLNGKRTGEAWLYTNTRPNFALGTSLCYWRKTWEAKPFEDIPKPTDMKGGKAGDTEGEDGRFLRGLKVCACTALTGQHDLNPRMVASIHGSNSSDQYRDIANSPNWKRVSEWDNRLREIMK